MKPIKLTTEWVQQMVEEFAKTLGGLKLSDGKVSYNKALTYEAKDEAGATVLFEPVAYAKMLKLLHGFDDEVAWHGTIDRLDKKTFVVKDIFVYPQEVTGGTVTTDQERYQSWLMELDDEVFNALHMQGHSHVNFATTPSATDTNFYDSILEQLGDDDYYIFMIFNKRLERTVKIYDMANNILYENKDVEVGILCDGGDLDQFIAEAKKDVVKKTYAYNRAGAAGVQPGVTPISAAPTAQNTGKGGKGKKGASAANKQAPLAQYPGYFGGYDPTGRYVDDTDYDAEIFGKRRSDWWNEK